MERRCAPQRRGPGACGLTERSTRRRIVVVTGEVLAPRLAGPAIRAREIARALARDHSVALVTTATCELAEEDDFEVRHADGDDLGAMGAEADVVVVQGDGLRRAPGLRDASVVVVDLYAPFHLEVLERSRGLDSVLRRDRVAYALDVVNEQLRLGDHFLCANSRQRDLCLGQLSAVGRVNEVVYDASPDLEGLVSVVPFGIESTPPRHVAPAIRGVIPGIGADDDVLFWGGGIYDWFDPLTLIRAVDDIRTRRPSVRLLFAGARHPNPAVGETDMARAARALAGELGLTGRHVFFEDWIDYDLRGSFLLESDLAVSTALEHVEATYSSRTRLLDAFWAALPVVTTGGDSLSQMIDERGAGVVVPAGDRRALVVALEAMLADPARRAAASREARILGAEHEWRHVLEPLVAFCDAPRRSPDLLDAATASAIARGGDLGRKRGPVANAFALVRRREWKSLRAKAERRVRRAR